jgi:hypothetical protein
MQGRALRNHLAVALALVLGVTLCGASPAWAGQAAAPSVAAAQAAPWLPSMAGQFYSVRSRLENGLTIDPGITVSLPVVGTSGIPAKGVASLALNFATKATAPGQGSLIVYPSDVSRPAVTGARYRGDIWNDDLLQVKVGADGRIKIENAGPVPVRVIIDVHGYTLTSAGATPGSTFVGLTPARIVNGASVPAGGTFSFSPLGKGGVPASRVSQVVFTLAGSSGADTPLTAYPSGTAPPVDVNLHGSPNGVKDNLVITGIGDDGNVIVSNRGQSAATVWVDVSGYFATPDATPAGTVAMPVTPVRIVNNVSIPGGGNFAVTTTASPASAVGVNLTVRSSNSTGSVRVYPSGVAQPGTWTLGYPTPGIYNSGFINAKLGADGRIIIHNSGASAVTVFVDLFTIFTSPTGCAAPATAAPPSVSVEESPVTVFQPRVGLLGQPIEYAYTADNGTVWYAHQLDPGNFGGAGFTVVPAPADEVFSGLPALLDQADGQLRLIAHGVSSNTWVDSQPGAASWSNLGGWMAGPPAAVRQADGTLALFALDGNGTLWATRQDNPNGAYTCWANMGMTSLTGSPAVATGPDGIQVFVRDTAGGVKTALYANRTLSGITDLGGSGLTGSIAVVDFPGSRVRIFVRGADGAILTKEQGLAGGGFPEIWDRVGTFTAAGSPSGAFDATGRIHVVARGTDGIVYHTSETDLSTGVWGDWSSAQPEGDEFRTAVDPTAFSYSLGNGGMFWAYVIRDSIRVVRVYSPGTAASTAGEGASPGFTATTLAARQK